MTIPPAAIEYATVPGSGLSETRLPAKPIDAILDVIAVVSNPVRYLSRYALYRQFARHIAASGARLWTVECAFGERPFEVTQEGNPQHIQVRTHYELWIKENLGNLGIARLPRDSRYIAFIDADIHFTNPDWVQQTIQALQHYDVIQPWSEAFDLGPTGEVIVDTGKDGIPRTGFKSFASSYVAGVPRRDGPGYYGGVPEDNDRSSIKYWWHPGFAWAFRRSALNTVGGLFDRAVVGEADFVMARSFLGEAEKTIYPGVSEGYRKSIMDWQVQALKLRGNLGFVPGAITHGWHGRKSARAYWHRCQILRDTQFDPTTDLKKDCEGLYQLVDHGDPRSLLLRNSLRRYFRSRNEDVMEL